MEQLIPCICICFSFFLLLLRLLFSLLILFSLCSFSPSKQKRKENRRSTMVVRMAQKKISAARRMEMIRRRSSIMREGGFLPSSRNVTTEEEPDRIPTVREISQLNREINNSSRASAHRWLLLVMPIPCYLPTLSAQPRPLLLYPLAL